MITEAATGIQYSTTQRAHYGTIGVRMSYSNLIQYTIPSRIASGLFNVSIHTDFRNFVFEYTFDGNNVLHRTFRIEQLLPDLTVSNTSLVLETTTRGNIIKLNYTITNEGSSSTSTPWSDRIGTSDQQLYSNRGTTVLLSVYQNKLTHRESREESLIFDAPRNLFGTVFIHIVVDYNRRVLEENESNNVHSIGPFTVPAIYPDLYVVQFISSVRDEVYAGERISLTWTVVNRGTGELFSERWLDAVYLDESREITPSSVTLTSVQISHSTALLTSMNYTQTVLVQLPIGFSGPYYLIISIDSEGNIDENDSDANNFAQISVYVNTPPSPDFMVTNVTFTYLAYNRILITEWTIENVGNSITETTSWTDQVYLLSDQSFNSQNALLIGSRVVELEVLESQQRYTSSMTVRLPNSILGNFYIYVEADGQKDIVEINGEDNNYGRTRNTVVIAQPPIPRLTIQIRNITTSIEAGQIFTLEYVVINVGDGPLRLANWVDAIYLTNSNSNSRNQVIENGILLSQRLINTALHVNESYNVFANITLPYTTNRQSYLTVLVDLNNNLDITITNAGGVNIFGYPLEHNIIGQTGVLPDLSIVVSNNTLTLQGGQPTTLMYNVENIGQTRAFGIWYDAIFLSNDPLLDPFDFRLKTVRNMIELEINSSYTQSVEVFIPFDLPSANYYFIYEVDTTQSIPDIATSNNIGYQIVNITETISTDLQVVSVTATPSELYYGEGKLLILIFTC